MTKNTAAPQSYGELTPVNAICQHLQRKCGTIAVMYLIVIAWFYVTAMMAVAEAASPQGSLLGAAVTFVLYGLLPMGILVYILGTPQRKRQLHARRTAEQQAYDDAQRQTTHTTRSNLPDASSHAPGTAQHSGIAPVREKL